MDDVEIIFFFFFQAEDGIRDLTVTGVQTCALPILLGQCSGRIINIASVALPSLPATDAMLMILPLPCPSMTLTAARETRRSEERRVGKEGRSRWAPDHLKKKYSKCRVQRAY